MNMEKSLRPALNTTVFKRLRNLRAYAGNKKAKNGFEYGKKLTNIEVIVQTIYKYVVL